LCGGISDIVRAELCLWTVREADSRDSTTTALSAQRFSQSSFFSPHSRIK
jgi:hypothetical protein